MQQILSALGIDATNSGACHGEWLDTGGGALLDSRAPRDDQPIASVRCATGEHYEQVVSRAREAFDSWRMVPAPQRGEIVRQIGEALRAHKAELGALVSLEMGKIRAEGEGEVQECIDIADFAVGLSRQLYGITMHSERAQHRMYEQWHPLGVVGIITAFNFPVAVWAWNAMIAAVCGNTMIWKPSEKTPLCAVALQHLVNRVLARNGHSGVMSLLIGEVDEIGERLIADPRVPLISATGSCRMGRRVAQVVAGRFGRTILELGGNNALIVMDDANLDLALRAILFGAVGTAGQRCTTTRRVLVHRAVAQTLTERLIDAYRQIRIGDPLDGETMVGPLIDADAVATMHRALETIQRQGGELLCGGDRVSDGALAAGHYLRPAIVRAQPELPMLKTETFAPILYIVTVDSLAQAISLQNDVPQGLSSAIFTDSLRHVETFLSHRGSDCGIANVNIGTSGAEIGGAFGGEKETGGGREAGSDSWKAYMRRQTNTINWGDSLPLAQGISFGESL